MLPDPDFVDTVPSHQAIDEESPTQKRPYSAPNLTIFGSLAQYLERRSLGVQPGHEVLPAPHEFVASWYCLDLTQEVAELIVDTWKLAWAVSRSRVEPDYSNAIFQKARPGKGLTLYFSPTAAPLSETFGAKPCDRPSPADMNLVAGDERAWQIHFGRVFARPKQPFAETRPSGLPEPTVPSPLQ
jgi:hypothetical protein